MRMDLKDIFLDIYLIRHADPAGLPNHWSSHTTPLSQLGVIQAEKLAKQLINHRFSAFFSSPFYRAKQTAEIIAKEIAIPVKIQEQDWLAEIDVGEWAGRQKEDIKQHIPATLRQLLKEGYNKRGPLVANLLAIDKNFSFPSGESIREFWNRVTTGFYKTISQYKGKICKNICFIGHGGSFTVIVLNLLGKSFSDSDFPLFMFRKADLSIIRIKNGHIFFLQMNPLLQSTGEESVDFRG